MTFDLRKGRSLRRIYTCILDQSKNTGTLTLQEYRKVTPYTFRGMSRKKYRLYTWAGPGRTDIHTVEVKKKFSKT